MCRMPGIRGKLRRGFSLIEVLVVIGIIGLLLALLMPALSMARRQAKTVQCRSNLRQIGLMLQIYQNENQGWLYPVGNDPATGQLQADYYGASRPPNDRWPMLVFKIPAPNPPPFDPAKYSMNPYDPDKFPAGPYTPAVLSCPADVDPYEAHSYCLNGHLAEHGVRAGALHLAGHSSSDVILMGEKVSSEVDYYMQADDFARVVELFRHGITLRSNYLFLDGHVAKDNPSPSTLDPWELDATN